MPKLVINGQNRIEGEITVQGAKNSVLPIIAATIQSQIGRASCRERV